MRNKTTMEMSICQAENGFSLNELVKNVADAYEKKAFADILKMNLQLTQEILIYLGLAESFADYATEQQRCHWHIKRDLYHMMYQDGGRFKDSKPIQDALAGVLAIELPRMIFKRFRNRKRAILRREWTS